MNNNKKQILLKESFEALRNERLEVAEKSLAKILKFDARDFEANALLGVVLAIRKRFLEAVGRLEIAVQERPLDPSSRFNLAKALLDADRLEEALQQHLIAKKLDPKNFRVLQNLGLTQVRLRKFEEAMGSFLEALELEPQNVECLSNLGALFNSQGMFEEALLTHSKALSFSRGHPEVWANLGLCLQNLGRLEDAMCAYNESLRLSPDSTSTLLNRATLFSELRDPSSALRDSDRLIEIQSDDAIAWMNRARYLFELGSLEASLQSAERAVQVDPNDPEVRFSFGVYLLTSQQFDRGWREFEWRKRRDGRDSKYPLSPLPAWDGRPLEKLLILGEQGIGDQVLYLSVLPEVLRRCAQISVTVNKKLVPAFRSAFPGVRFLPLGAEGGAEADAHIWMGDLPRFFRSKTSDFPKTCAFLRGALQDRGGVRAVAPQKRRLRIGLSWKSTSEKEGKKKSVPLRDLLSRLGGVDADFVCLQYGNIEADLASLPTTAVSMVRAGCDVQDDIVSLLHAIDGCDLLISCSGTNAHLAGALGKRVILLTTLAAGKFFYWSNERNGRSLWYPSITLLRQELAWDWSHSLDRLPQLINSEFPQD